MSATSAGRRGSNFQPKRRSASCSTLVGVKIYERPASGKSLDDLFAEWKDLGIGTAFAGEALAEDSEFRRLAAERGIDLFVIAPVFYNPAPLAKDPDLYAVTADGS